MNNLENIKLKFENLLREGLKKDNLTIGETTFKMGVNYYFNELNNLSKRCIFGLSVKETLILRERLGINLERKILTFDEIRKKYGILDNVGLFNYSLMMIRRNIKNINTILVKELKEEPIIYKTLLGELNLSKKTFGLLQSYNIYTLGDLVSYSVEDLLKFRSIGKHNLDEIIKALNELGFKLKNESKKTNELDTSISNSTLEDLEILSKEEIERRKRELELEKLKIKHQRITMEIENLLKQQEKIEEEIQTLINGNNLKK